MTSFTKRPAKFSPLASAADKLSLADGPAATAAAASVAAVASLAAAAGGSGPADRASGCPAAAAAAAAIGQPAATAIANKQPADIAAEQAESTLGALSAAVSMSAAVPVKDRDSAGAVGDKLAERASGAARDGRLASAAVNPLYSYAHEPVGARGQDESRRAAGPQPAGRAAPDNDEVVLVSADTASVGDVAGRAGAAAELQPRRWTPAPRAFAAPLPKPGSLTHPAHAVRCELLRPPAASQRRH